MRVLVTGRSGQVAQCLQDVAARRDVELVSVGRPYLDLEDPGSVLPAVARLAPDVIVSAAGYTAVDKAETEPAVAYRINGAGAGAVAAAAGQLGVPLIHLSTDYVFDGFKSDPYDEEDIAVPLSVYGASKLEGERQVRAATDNHVILRAAWLYSPYGGNFLKTMLRLAQTRNEIAVVADQRGGPTSAIALAEGVITIARQLTEDVSRELRGTFHFAPAGDASWAEFAAAIMECRRVKTGRSTTIIPIATSDYPTAAQRPANSRLNAQRLAQIHGIRLPHWQWSTQDIAGHLLAREMQEVTT
ncbi:dTDP-4-dehydrorhamnose reductase [Pseudorhizobium pelagicum]|uniref:dTDP-4-dehydrorhamnose reductase n=1 Tax=Pseudorhizobium pelagicum TaxID=1509405 RepID=A0A922P3L7_9HYPH|nr:dTDP-4-dehydrorhamnose reductase [Pseudorhizobium pelagicum]KEQ04512.1 dTDP-4-dehydrorhamnose reductase [Pseudorhizobium pelagicum]KEQ06672.1 dTDP-4-dehydrorhamnose reductase [Pseudorhizobium pelagicum]